MKIYDISQEVFSCRVYPGDPVPRREQVCSMEQGDTYNLTAFSMCAHNGTHIDAPFHFLKDGKSVEQLALSQTVGLALVVAHHGSVTAADAAAMLGRLDAAGLTSNARLLIKGDTVISLEAAEVFANAKLALLGNESQSVGPEEAPMAVHLALLGAGVVLLEGIRLSEVPDGIYFLSAAPLSLAGADGAPCRAYLIELNDLPKTREVPEPR